MIRGDATIDATAGYAVRHAPVSHAILGRTRLTAGYRISSGVNFHEKALAAAIRSGINLIDTSANYADGGSETLVGQVLENLTAGGQVKREEIIVISKVGYLQGQNFAVSKERKDKGQPFQDLVEYGEGLEHCIHPELKKGASAFMVSAPTPFPQPPVILNLPAWKPPGGSPRL